MSTGPDLAPLQSVIASLDQLSRQWRRRAEEVDAALAAGHEVEVSRSGVTLTVRSPALVGARFDAEAERLGPVRLREAVLGAYAEAVTATTRSQAAAVVAGTGEPALGEAIESSLDEDLRERTRGADPVEQLSAPAPTDRPVAASEVPGIGEPDADHSDIQPGQSIAEIMADTEWDRYRPTSEPGLWQYELEQRVAAISRDAAGLSEAVEQIRVSEEAGGVSVTVNAAGALTDVRFTAARSIPAARLGEHLLALCSRAATSARAELAAELTRRSRLTPGPDDPTQDLFRRLDAAIEHGLQTARPEDPR